MDVNEHERLSNITSLTVELGLLKLEGTVKMYWCYQKFEPPKFSHFWDSFIAVC
jgi:hypothetical protein